MSHSNRQGQTHVQIVPSRAILSAHITQHHSHSTLFASPHIQGSKTVVSWMSPPENAPNKEYLEADGLTRFNFGSSVAFVGVLSANELSYPMLWDAFHALPVGGEIVVVDYVVNSHNCILYREYFNDCVDITEVDTTPSTIVFKKTAITRAERNAGLGDWSFCIPITHPNANTLEQIKAQIEALGLDRHELLVCAPADYEEVISKYGTYVPEPQNGTLAEKKNTLAAAARHGNLCIFHDRVSLPSNFKSAVEAYGDNFGLAHFQSLVFDPTINQIIRYSDYHINLSTNATFFGDTNKELHLKSTFSNDSTLFREWNSEFSIANPRLYAPQMYGTGTLYLCKKAVWEFCGQAPEIDWNDLEDLEHGHRSIAMGIPSRVNPYAFTRTRRARAIMLGPQRHQINDWSNLILGDSQVLARDSTTTRQIFDINPTKVRKELYAFIDDFIPVASRRHASAVLTRSSLSTAQSLFEAAIEILHIVPVLREPGFIRTMISRFLGCFPFGAHDESSVRRLTTDIMRGGYYLDVIIGSSEFHSIADLCETGILIDADVQNHLSDAIMRTWANKHTPVAFNGSYSEFSKAIVAAFQ